MKKPAEKLMTLAREMESNVNEDDLTSEMISGRLKSWIQRLADIAISFDRIDRINRKPKKSRIPMKKRS